MDYKELYLHLFNAVTDAIGLISEQDCDEARQLLIKAQQDCEDMHIFYDGE